VSIMKRVRDITVATLNDMLDKAEDPVKLIDSYLFEQRSKIEQAEQLYRQCMTHAESMRRQYEHAEIMAEKREQQAMTALKAGEENIARLALKEKLIHEEKRDQFKELYEKAKWSLVDLEDQLQQLKSDYDEVLSKRQYYAARMESIRLQQRMNERLGGSAAGTERAFRRLEDRILDMEFEARSLGELRRKTQETLYRAGTAVRETLETELEMLRRKLEKEGWTGQ
jgi:Phage shock protein A (IM30), suppresses sigma54-dependent transcription